MSNMTVKVQTLCDSTVVFPGDYYGESWHLPWDSYKPMNSRETLKFYQIILISRCVPPPSFLSWNPERYGCISDLLCANHCDKRILCVGGVSRMEYLFTVDCRSSVPSQNNYRYDSLLVRLTREKPRVADDSVTYLPGYECRCIKAYQNIGVPGRCWLLNLVTRTRHRVAWIY